MADLICRWRNGTPKNVMEVVNSMPHHEMPEWQFKDFMNKSVWGNSFSRTVYQFASQLALYYISDDGVYHPRFDHDINELEAKDYMERWLPRYYIPNPYVSSDGFNKIDCPTLFLKSLYDYAVNHSDCTYEEAYKACFQEIAKNNDDIIRNYINSYAKVLIFQKNGRLSITDVDPQNIFNNMDRNDRKAFFDSFNLTVVPQIKLKVSTYRPFITAIKSKPFLLLAGISGTGKSRIVRELARACWDKSSEEYKAQKPRNFEMVQVKPNWHDSSELIGYVSRVSGEPVYVAGDFMKFVARAWEEQDVPYFLCLDEMNLAPVEQYFAEYLSVVESRKANTEGVITTDPLLKSVSAQWYWNLCSELTSDEELREQFRDEGISIPQNLIVIGTVNMDETTFSFSRKVLDRAMTIEMNEVNLKGGLTERYEQIGKLGAVELIGNAVEGVDVYDQYRKACDISIAYLESINAILEGTPFKVAYRTRNEVLLYVVNNLPYQKEGETKSFVAARALDEITNMKILSRIEGDETKVSRDFLDGLGKTIKEGLETVCNNLFTELDYKSVSLTKLDEMKKRLASGYTSFWS